jgi:myo-inositol-1(or 4)-monophosphatase
MASRSALITVMARAAERAAKSLRRDFGEVEQLQISLKGPGDFVSQADQRAEEALRDELARARPDYGFLLEESGTVAGLGDTRWIIDPLDGTTNFLHGIPHFSISIAAERAGDIIAGLIYDPIRDEMFWAEKGGGAYLNNKRLRVSTRRKLTEAVIATGIPHLGRPGQARFSEELSRLMKEVAGVRRMGSAALDLAYVAAGRYEGYWEHALQLWDIAAGILLVSEAGGYVTDLNGAKKPLLGENILAAPPYLHSLILKLLNPN